MNSPTSVAPRLHVLLINTGKAEALDELRRVVPDARVRIVTEASYEGLYDDGEDLHFVRDVGDLGEVLAVALRLSASAPFDAVISPSERSMPAGGYLRSYFSLPGVPFETANLFTNKAAMKSRLRACGIRVADHRDAVGREGLEASVRAVGFPAVIKPALGTGSMNTFVLGTEDEFLAFLTSDAAEALLERPRLLVVEQYLDVLSEVTCDGIVVDGKVVFALASRYTTPLIQDIGGMLGAVSLESSDALSSEIQEHHARAVEALGLVDGVTHLEVLVTREGVYVGEIACRPGGAGVVDNARLARGVDLWDAFMRMSLGWSLPRYPAEPEDSRGAYLWSALPTRPGRVSVVSNEADFSHIDGLLKVDMHVRAGETIGSRVHSSSTTGLVYFRIGSADRRLVASKIEELAAAYRLELASEEAPVMATGGIA